MAPVRSLRLRRWQKHALDLLDEQAAGRADFLAVATPGAGKTTFALAAAARSMAAHPGRRLVVVAPTSHLKVQWAAAADRLGVLLDPAWATSTRLPRSSHGVAVTYQQVALSPEALASAARNAFVILDEVHHAGDERSWGDACRTAFEGSPFRLALSGTPFRSDTRAIPFVDYHLDEARPDYEYGYGDALRDGRVVRPVYFPRIGGFMEWVAPDGAQLAADFDDPLDRVRSSQRLRTALSVHGEWLPAVLGQANRQLLELRREQPDAAGLVIATDHEHARGIADLLDRRFRARAVVVLSDDPRASERIAEFAESDRPWLVAVRMVSEGVDIPRLRLGVYATTTTTELFFRQAVGRFVRWTGRAPREKAYLFIPDDPRLRLWAHGIAEQRRHSLRRDRRAEVEGAVPDDGSALDAQRHPDDLLGDEQLSLFTALSAVAHEGPHPVASVFDEPVGEPETPDDDPELVVALSAPPLPGGADPSSAAHRRRAAEALRRYNAGLVTELVRFTGLSHAQVNGELNRLAGVTRIGDADVAQLERRARKADAWLSRLCG
jgi:superfamily II DNA or RNA helicase